MFNRYSFVTAILRSPFFPFKFSLYLVLTFIHVLNNLVQEKRDILFFNTFFYFLNTFSIFLSKEWIMPSCFHWLKSFTVKIQVSDGVTVCLWVWACMHLICSHRALSWSSPTFFVCLNVAGTSPTATVITKGHAFSDGSVTLTGP